MNQRSFASQLIAIVLQIRQAIAGFLTSLPFWPDVVRICGLISGPLIGLSRFTIGAFPVLRKAEWLLEIESLSQRHPVSLAFAISLVFYRGLMPTHNGHIGNDAMIFPLLGAVSGFNPFLGLLCGAAFGVGDFIQKLVWNDIYGAELGRLTGNYWGAMFGYIIAYSSTMSMGMLPGVVSRICRLAARTAWQQISYRRSAAAADGAQPNWGGVPGSPNAQQPIWLNLNKEENKAALRQLLDDPRDLFRDPDSWRSADLTPHQKLLMANLRGKRMLGPEAAAQWRARLGSDTNAAVSSDLNAPLPGTPGPPPADGEPSLLEIAASIVGAGIAGTVQQGLIAPIQVWPAFYLRPKADVSCYAAELGVLHGSAPAAGFGAGLGAGADTISRIPQPRSPQELAGIVNQINQESGGSPALSGRAQQIVDNYNQTGQIDPQAVADLQRDYDAYSSGVSAAASTRNQANTDDFRSRQEQAAAQQAADEQNQRDLAGRYDDLIRTYSSGGNASSTTMNEIDRVRAQVVDPRTGRIDPGKLNELANDLRGWSQGQRDHAAAAAADALATANLANDFVRGAQIIRDVSFTAVGAFTGGAAAAAGANTLWTAAAVNAGIGAITGGATAASEGNSVLSGAGWGGLMGGGMGTVFGALGQGGRVGEILSSVNPTLLGTAIGSTFGAGQAWWNGQSVVDGALHGGLMGGIGGKFGSLGHNWGSPIPPGSVPGALSDPGASPRGANWGRSPWDAKGFDPSAPAVFTNSRGPGWGTRVPSTDPVVPPMSPLGPAVPPVVPEPPGSLGPRTGNWNQQPSRPAPPVEPSAPKDGPRVGTNDRGQNWGNQPPAKPGPTSPEPPSASAEPPSSPAPTSGGRPPKATSPDMLPPVPETGLPASGGFNEASNQLKAAKAAADAARAKLDAAHEHWQQTDPADPAFAQAQKELDAARSGMSQAKDSQKQAQEAFDVADPRRQARNAAEALDRAAKNAKIAAETAENTRKFAEELKEKAAQDAKFEDAAKYKEEQAKLFDQRYQEAEAKRLAAIEKHREAGERLRQHMEKEAERMREIDSGVQEKLGAGQGPDKKGGMRVVTDSDALATEGEQAARTEKSWKEPDYDPTKGPDLTKRPDEGTLGQNFMHDGRMTITSDDFVTQAHEQIHANTHDKFAKILGHNKTLTEGMTEKLTHEYAAADRRLPPGEKLPKSYLEEIKVVDELEKIFPGKVREAMGQGKTEELLRAVSERAGGSGAATPEGHGLKVLDQIDALNQMKQDPKLTPGQRAAASDQLNMMLDKLRQGPK